MSGVDQELRRLLTDVIGSGPKTADDMTYEEAVGAMDRILAGTTDPRTLGAFLLACRWKTNTPTELAGFLDAVRSHVDVATPSSDPVDCGANYDGKQKTVVLGVAAATVAAAAGVPIALHAGIRLPAKRADTYRHVLDTLGIATDLAPSESARMLDETGVGFYYQPQFAPALHGLRDTREALGVRTPINSIETLVNPASASRHLGSFFHRSYGERLVETLARSRTVDVDRVLMIQGLEGYDDVRPGRTTVVEWVDGTTTDWTIDPTDLGLDVDREQLQADDVAVDSAALTETVLAGEQGGAIMELVALNAGLRIYAGGAVDSLGDGVDLAWKTIADGEGRRVLSALQSFEPMTTDVRARP